MYLGVLLLIFQFIPCNDGFPLRTDICTLDDSGNYLIENTVFALRQIFTNVPLFMYVFGYTVSTAIQNMFGIAVTKFASAAVKAVTDNLRPVLVWLFFLLVKNGKGETEKFLPLQLIGFILMVTGIIIYNEILELPFCGLNLKTKSHLKKIEMQKEEKDFVNYQEKLIEGEIKEIENLDKSNTINDEPPMSHDSGIKEGLTINLLNTNPDLLVTDKQTNTVFDKLNISGSMIAKDEQDGK